MFIESLLPVEVVQGSPAKLQCRVTGTPEPTIEWFRDSEPLTEDKRVKIRFDGELCTLKILETELEDEGAYKCFAKNEFGSDSCASELLVNEPYKKPEFTQKLKPINVIEGEAARFDATVEGNPIPVVDWFHGKNKLEDDGRFVVMDDEEAGIYTLIIEDTVLEDAGTYKCIAANEEGQASCKAALAVKEQMITPEFTNEEQSAPFNVMEGDEVRLMVGIKGKPAPTVEWYKDDKKLRKTSRVRMDEKDGKFSLVISDVTSEDRGTYKCEASSKAGTVTRTFDVNVAGKVVLQ